MACRIAVVICLTALMVRCSPFRPSCTGESGIVTSLTGTAGAGEIGVHVIAYGTQGSQNDITVAWTGQGQPGAPDIQVHVTGVSCEDITRAGMSPECAILSRAGRIDGHVVSRLIVTHGRGNPERLGNPPAFKIWIVGDAAREAAYSLEVRWRLPVEC